MVLASHVHLLKWIIIVVVINISASSSSSNFHCALFHLFKTMHLSENTQSQILILWIIKPKNRFYS